MSEDCESAYWIISPTLIPVKSCPCVVNNAVLLFRTWVIPLGNGCELKAIFAVKSLAKPEDKSEDCFTDLISWDLYDVTDSIDNDLETPLTLIFSFGRKVPLTWFNLTEVPLTYSAPSTTYAIAPLLKPCIRAVRGTSEVVTEVVSVNLVYICISYKWRAHLLAASLYGDPWEDKL